MKTFKTHTVSIIEDEELIGRSLKNFINESSSFSCANHYLDAATSIIGIMAAPPHLIICDIGLPDMSGVECMQMILKEHPGIKFIMFTVFDTEALLFTALKEGASGYLLKDDSFQDIVKAIEDVINGGGAMSPTIAKKVIASFKSSQKKRSNELLTEHQQHILQLIADGMLNKEIAHKLKITEGTVKVQITSIYKKLQVYNRVEATNYFNKEK